MALFDELVEGKQMEDPEVRVALPLERASGEDKVKDSGKKVKRTSVTTLQYYWTMRAIKFTLGLGGFLAVVWFVYTAIKFFIAS